MVAVHVSRLTLQNFRNFADLDMELCPGRTVLYGGNAQGKTNVLEATYMLATARSTRATHEREIIKWEALEEEIPFARVRGEVDRADGAVRLEIVVQLARGQIADGLSGRNDSGQLQKRVRVNGVPRRAGDLLGQMTAVLFAPQDLELVHGSPSGRRRYLDMTLSQVDRSLFRELQRYARVLPQRNSLLRAIRDRRAGPDELPFWDRELVEAGSFIVSRRMEAFESLNVLTKAAHNELTHGEEIELRYLPSVSASPSDVPAAFEAGLAAAREKELLQGVSLVGPHKDDFQFLMGGHDMGAFGSRGQQRTAALALKLAEAQFITDCTGQSPVLLLDDAFSELDGHRRSYLQARTAGWEQTIMTTADPDSIGQEVLAGATMVELVGGAAVPR